MELWDLFMDWPMLCVAYATPILLLCLADRLLNTFHWNVFLLRSWTYAAFKRANAAKERPICSCRTFFRNNLSRIAFCPRQSNGIKNLRLKDIEVLWSQIDYLIFSSGRSDRPICIDDSATEVDWCEHSINPSQARRIECRRTVSNRGNKTCSKDAVSKPIN